MTKRLRLQMEDPTRYLPSTHLNVQYRWYVYNDAEIDSLTKQSAMEMSGTRAECEAFIARQS